MPIAMVTLPRHWEIGDDGEGNNTHVIGCGRDDAGPKVAMVGAVTIDGAADVEEAGAGARHPKEEAL